MKNNIRPGARTLHLSCCLFFLLAARNAVLECCRRTRRESVVFLCCVLWSGGGALSAGQIEIAAYGTTLSGAVLTSAEIRFDEAVNPASLQLVDGNGDVIPHYFRAEPQPGYSGTLYWMFREVPMFHIEKYTLHYDSGEWTAGAVGDPTIGERVESVKVILGNGSFEQLNEGVPVGWELANARVSDKYAYTGSNSVEISAREGQGQYGVSPAGGRIKVESGKRYRLGFRLLIPQPEDGSVPEPTGNRSMRVTGDITYYTADGKRLNRNMTHYYVMLDEAHVKQLGQWVLVQRGISNTPRSDDGATEATVGITVSGFDGKVYIDQVVLEEVYDEEPFRFEISGATSGQ